MVVANVKVFDRRVTTVDRTQVHLYFKRICRNYVVISIERLEWHQRSHSERCQEAPPAHIASLPRGNHASPSAQKYSFSATWSCLSEMAVEDTCPNVGSVMKLSGTPNTGVLVMLNPSNRNSSLVAS